MKSQLPPVNTKTPMPKVKPPRFQVTARLNRAKLGQSPPEFGFSEDGLTIHFTDGSSYFVNLCEGLTKEQIANQLEHISKCLKGVSYGCRVDNAGNPSVKTFDPASEKADFSVGYHVDHLGHISFKSVSPIKKGVTGKRPELVVIDDPYTDDSIDQQPKIKPGDIRKAFKLNF